MALNQGRMPLPAAAIHRQQHYGTTLENTAALRTCQQAPNRVYECEIERSRERRRERKRKREGNCNTAKRYGFFATASSPHDTAHFSYEKPEKWKPRKKHDKKDGAHGRKWGKRNTESLSGTHTLRHCVGEGWLHNPFRVCG